MSMKRVHRHVKGGVVNVAGSGATPFQQPRSFVDFSEADDGVEWVLDVEGIVGTATSWYLTCKTQFGHADVGLGYGFSKFRWYDLQPEQIAAFHAEGVDWYGGAGQVTGTLVNLLTNPSVEGSSNWVHDAGSGGTGTGVKVSNGTAFSRASHWRTTFTTAPNSGTGGLRTSRASVTPGTAYSAGLYVRPSKEIYLRGGIEQYTAGSASLGTDYGAATLCHANSWTRISAANITAKSTAVEAAARVLAASGAQWASGDTLDGDAAMVNQGPVLLDFFDGASPGAAWDGAADSSTSSITVTADGIKTVARSTDTLPLTVSRKVLGSRMLERLWVQVHAVNPSPDFGVRYSLVSMV